MLAPVLGDIFMQKADTSEKKKKIQSVSNTVIRSMFDWHLDVFRIN